MKKFILMLCLICSSLYAKEFRFDHVLDDTGREFLPGDYIQINTNGIDVKRVEMDCKGLRGAIATLYINGHSYGRKRLSKRRDVYTWYVPNVDSHNIEIKFSAVDPIVYRTTVVYDSPVETRVETRVEYEEVEVAMRQQYGEVSKILTILDKLSDNVALTDTYADLIDEGLRITEEAVYASERSYDSDASIVTHGYVMQLLDTLDCKKARKVLRVIQKSTRENRRLIRELRKILSVIREQKDYHILQCSPFVESL